VDVDDILQELKQQMRGADAQYPLLPGLCYRSPFGFVLEHGREYTGKWDSRWPIGVQKMCFGNAIAHAGIDRLKYVEGFAVAPSGEAFLHGWNTDESGTLIDTTWANTGLCYFGVEFSLERADDASWNGDACVLNDEHRGYPLFQRRWTGEDYSIVWPHSDRIERLYTREPALPPSVREWLSEIGKEGILP
jgi:hypothetical protein